jgi:hypothetical protein
MGHAEAKWIVTVTDSFVDVTHRETQHCFRFARIKQAPYINTESFLERFENLDSVPDELIDEAIEIALGSAAEEAV